MSIQLSCSTICFRDSPVEEALNEIRALGFNRLELAVIPDFCPHFDAANATETEWEYFINLILNSGFKVETVTAVPGHFNAPDADAEAIAAAGAANCALAKRLGAQGLNVNCGKPVNDRAGFETHAELAARGLKRIAREAAENGVPVNIEMPNRNGLVRTLDEAEYVMELIGEDNARYLLDTTHILAGGERPDAAVRRLGNRIGHVRLRDGKGGDVVCVPGEGDIDFRAFFEALGETGYKGGCSLELEGVGETPEERRSAVRRALDHFSKTAGAPPGTL